MEAQGADGQTFFDVRKNSVEIHLRGRYSADVLSHELKHAYQFEVGSLGFGSPNRRGGGWLHDLTDEDEAYRRGKAYGSQRSLEARDYPSLTWDPVSLSTPNGMSTYGKQIPGLNFGAFQNGMPLYYYKNYLLDLSLSIVNRIIRK